MLRFTISLRRALFTQVRATLSLSSSCANGRLCNEDAIIIDAFGLPTHRNRCYSIENYGVKPDCLVLPDMTRTHNRGMQTQSRIGTALIRRADEHSMLRHQQDPNRLIALLAPLTSALARVAAAEDTEHLSGQD